MPVEFLGIAATNEGSEVTPRSGASFGKAYTLKLARAHEDHGWDRVLFAYGSGSPDPSPAAAYIAARTETRGQADRPDLPGTLPTGAALFQPVRRLRTGVRGRAPVPGRAW